MRLPKTILIIWMLLFATLHLLITPSLLEGKIKPLDTFDFGDNTWKWESLELTAGQDMLKSAIGKRYDDYLSRLYIDENGNEFAVQIFYSSSRRPGNRLTTSANSVNCLHGHYRKITEQLIDLTDKDKAIRLDMAKDSEQATAIYWLQSRNKISAFPFHHLIWQYRQDLTMRPSDGFFVKITFAGKPNESKLKKQLRLSRLVAEALKKQFK